MRKIAALLFLIMLITTASWAVPNVMVCGPAAYWAETRAYRLKAGQMIVVRSKSIVHLSPHEDVLTFNRIQLTEQARWLYATSPAGNELKFDLAHFVIVKGPIEFLPWGTRFRTKLVFGGTLEGMFRHVHADDTGPIVYFDRKIPGQSGLVQTYLPLWEFTEAELEIL